MRVALDFRMANHTGIGRYLRCLLPAVIEADPELEILLLIPDDVEPPGPLPARVERARWPNAPKIYSWEEQWAFERLRQRLNFDLVHLPHFQAPLFSGPPMVVTIQDLVFLQFPEECPSTAARIYAQAAMPLIARRARRVLTGSHTVAEEVHQHLGVCRSKIVCTPYGPPPRIPSPGKAEAERIRESYGIAGKYLLSVGMQRPRKNLARLVRAYHRTKLWERGIQLVLAGPKDPRGADVGVEIRRLDLLAHVRQTGFIEDSELAALYTGAQGMVVPSLHEGFGFGPLEAWGFGLPVAASRAGALPEVCGPAAHYFDPKSEAEIAAGLEVLAEDSEARTQLIAAGIRHREALNWADCGRRTAEAYRAALGLPSRWTEESRSEPG